VSVDATEHAMNRKPGRHDSAAQPAPLQMRMECPDCAAGIELSLPTLLLGRPVWCGGCGVRLDIDLQASGDVLRRIDEGVRQLSAVRDRPAVSGRR
jgi:hypothetical protein